MSRKSGSIYIVSEARGDFNLRQNARKLESSALNRLRASVHRQH